MKQYGLGTVFGFATMTNRGGPWTVYGPFGADQAASSAGQKLETLEDTEEADIEELRDENGELIGAAVRNRRNTITIDWIPAGVRTSADGTPETGKNTIDNALQAMTMPGVWTEVTLQNLPDSSGEDIGWNKKYIYRGGGSRSLNTDANGRVRLTLEDPSVIGGIGSPLTTTELTTEVAPS